MRPMTVKEGQKAAKRQKAGNKRVLCPFECGARMLAKNLRAHLDKVHPEMPNDETRPDDVPDGEAPIKIPCERCGKDDDDNWKTYISSGEIEDHIKKFHLKEMVVEHNEEQKPPLFAELEKLSEIKTDPKTGKTVPGADWTLIVMTPDGQIDVQSNLIRPGMPATYRLAWRKKIEIVYEQRDALSKR